MTTNDRRMPRVMQELHELDFDYADGAGVDFEPYSEFLTVKETESWIRAWTGNHSLDGHEYLIFGQDGSGGYAAFWCIRASGEVVDQPIVFFGSEGSRAVIARGFSDYLWLLSGGLGPMEACENSEFEARPNSAFEAFAAEHAPSQRKSPAAVLAAARQEFPEFDAFVDSLCR